MCFVSFMHSKCVCVFAVLLLFTHKTFNLSICLWLEMELTKKTKHQRLNLDDEVSVFLPHFTFFTLRFSVSISRCEYKQNQKKRGLFKYKYTLTRVFIVLILEKNWKLHKSQFDCFHFSWLFILSSLLLLLLYVYIYILCLCFSFLN